MEAPVLSIIVVSYNTKEMLQRCLNTIQAASITLPYEVIVVDNASTDESAEMVHADYPRVRLIRSPGNLGFAGANAAGIGIAQGEYVLLLNSDAFVTRGLAEALCRHLASHAAAAAAGPRILNEDGSLQSQGFIFPFIWSACLGLLRVRKLLSRRALERYLPRFYWNELETRQVDWVSGCCIMMKRSALSSLGGLNECFFMYWEDMEWCHRARKQRFEIWYCGNVSVVHANRSSPSPKREEIALASSNIFYRVSDMRMTGCVIAFIGILSNMVSIASAALKGDRDGVKQYFAKVRGACQFIWELCRSNPKQAG